MDKELFKKILKPQIASLSAKNPSEAAKMVAKAYDKSLKSNAFTQSGQKFLNSDVSGLETVFKYAFELNNLSRQLSSSVEPGWTTMAVGISKYWLTATFNLLPPSPPAASTTNVLVTFPGDIKKLPEKLKFAFNQGDTEKFVETLADVLINYQSKIAGQYIGVSANGVPVVKPWIGVLGEKPEQKETKKGLIETIRISDWTPITKPSGYTIKFIDGVWRGNITGKYAARFDSNAKMLIPSVNKTALISGEQLNGRLSLDLLVKIQGEPGLLEKNAGNAYLKMKQDALSDGVSITFNSIISGYRPLGKPGDLKLRNKGNKKHFTQWSQREDYNECLFDNGWNQNSTNEQKKKAEKLCARDFAMPTFDNYGTSNHGWGRSVDIGSKGAPKLEAQKWIRENGWKYGWYWGEQPDEEWHFTWVLTGNIPLNLDIGTFYIRNERGEIDPSNE